MGSGENIGGSDEKKVMVAKTWVVVVKTVVKT
jgi:hypothetical protein